MLKLFNTLTRRLELFKPINEGKVGIYSCGITAYYLPHIGNMRQYVVQDLLKRLLIHNGYSVKHVQNVTDVGHLVSDADTGDDKLRAEAKKEQKSMKEVAEFYLNIFMKDMDELNIIKPDVMPKASEHIEDMINLIKELENKGYVYKADDGMYFDTSLFRDYGMLTGMDAKELSQSLMEGARIGKKEGKRNITDFCLWRFAHGDEKEMIWGSPWGKGFPGWHIECSAMSMKYLGEHFDIHCGGIDHIQVHHTNEIAQSEAATGEKFVNYWFETNFLTVNGAKMSKSLRSIYTVSDVLSKGYTAMALRLFLLSGKHEQTLNFTFDALKDAQNSLDGIYAFIRRMSGIKRSGDEINEVFMREISESAKSFFAAVEEDLNLPEALSAMYSIISKTNQRHESGKLSKKEADHIIEIMLDIDSILGLRLSIQKEESALSDSAKNLIEEREAARKAKDFEKADSIRDKLLNEYGIVLEDAEEGPTWHKKAKGF
jgi:cysteinyl-tRNA synthetase